MGLKHLAEDDRVDRREAQVGEEPGLGSNLIGVFPPREVAQEFGNVRIDRLPGMYAHEHRLQIDSLILGRMSPGPHQTGRSPTVQAQTKSPFRSVTTRIDG